MNQPKTASVFNIAVIVAALGYFVDIYDLLLFSIIRKPSLTSLGLSPDLVVTKGELILGIQMAGLMIGGIIWGVMGDKKGRLSVLFGSIILYSLANVLNGFVQNVNQYALVRFIAGLGLAGELGAGITLVSELLPKEKRGIGTSLVAGIGLTGAVVAYFVSQEFDWRVCFYVGGGLGLLLLLLRLSVFESSMFHQIRQLPVSRGNFLMFFTNRKRFKKYLLSILIGLPTWYIIGVLVSFSDKFAEEFGITEKVSPGKAVMYAYAAIAVGDVLIGLVSQWLKSRKKALVYFLCHYCNIYPAVFYATQRKCSPNVYYMCGLGFWYRILGHFCYDGSRTVWNQPESHGGDHYSEYGTWRSTFSSTFI